MGLYNKLPSNVSEVDVIIAGGGAAGCIVASRLAQADPNLVVLLVESGPNNDIESVNIPALYVSNLVPTSGLFHWYQSQAEQDLGGRELIVPAGRVLGGGSSVNVMIYSRAQRSDMDLWNKTGWTANEMLPFMRQLETYSGAGAKAVHGTRGPIQVSRGTYHVTRFEDDYISAAKSLGWSETNDLQDLDSINAVERGFHYINPQGRRSDVASAYIHPLLQEGRHPNLHVLVETQVLRVLFDENKTATGIEYRGSPDLQPNEQSTLKVRARKMVVVSCGGIGTPALLERSGVGKPEVLERAGVQVIANVSGVGHEYNDHAGYGYPYRSSLAPNETLDGLLSGRLDVRELIRSNDPILGWNAVDIAAKVRPTEDEVAALGPEFGEAWNRDFKDNPDRPLTLLTGINGFPLDPSLVPPGQYFSVGEFAPYPYSRGYVHITGPSVDDPLDFKTGYLSDPLDMKMHVWAYKKQREIARRMEVYRGEVALAHPPFSACSKAALIQTNAPLSKDVQDIEYTSEDDDVIETWLRSNIDTMWHSQGTCKIGPLDEHGVVDSSLSVYGVANLRLADLSILPGNIGANTNNMALTVGERAADIFIHALGLIG
ncbi:hypothetical protein S40288_08838 [Stachybotrys chartarum IBT 40288]|nr:hypothetical protein S40288_08838 [Stachybotrys chartarum IBT 40288]